MEKNECKNLFLIFLLLLCESFNCTNCKPKPKLCFPEDFRFGVATSAYQIEGACRANMRATTYLTYESTKFVDLDSFLVCPNMHAKLDIISQRKGQSIWDNFTHTYPWKIKGKANADDAADSYNLFDKDVKMLRNLGVKFYRFSISWPRIIPDGLTNNTNAKGIIYYHNLLDELLHNGIEPMITMYHWDLPQYLQQLGGWVNPNITGYFEDYAKVLFDNFYDRVKWWITFNEPMSFCYEGYGGTMSAPGHGANGIEDYLCGHNVLRAHARAYHLYQQYKKKRGGNGKVGIAINLTWKEPASQSEVDKKAADRALQFEFGWFAHPIYSKEGDYPQIMRERVDANSKRQNYSRSRLPTFTKEEVETIRGSADFLGLNHYTTNMASEPTKRLRGLFDNDEYVQSFTKPEWPLTNSNWLRVVPWGFRKAANWVKDTYNNTLVIVTENGMSADRGLEDQKRINYIASYLRELHAAVTKDGCNVKGYTYWSLMDNFEWSKGYSEAFGLYEVNFKSVMFERTPRASANYYSEIAQTGCIPA